MKLKGFCAIKRGPVPVTGPLGSPYRAIGSPYRAIGSPYRPSVPLTGALLLSNCRSQPGFNCIGPRGASKNIGPKVLAGPKEHLFWPQ